MVGDLLVSQNEIRFYKGPMTASWVLSMDRRPDAPTGQRPENQIVKK